MLLPFLLLVIQRKEIFLRGLLLLLPIAGAIAASFAYNAAAFGSPFRNGYHFWSPIPMDYPAMTFSLSFVRMNLEEVGCAVLALVALVFLGAGTLAWRRRPTATYGASQESFRGAVVFFVLTTAPILVFHLLYFFPADRFHIPMMAGAVVLGGSMLSLLVGPEREPIFKGLLPVALLLAVVGRMATPAPLPLRRMAADIVRKNTPTNAIVISAIDPVYLGRLAGAGSMRRIIPLSRNVEYASALLVRKRVDDPRLRGLTWDDARTVALIRPQAEEATPFVASERLNDLVREEANGIPIFFESSFVDQSEAKVLAELQTRFKLIYRASGLYQLQSL